MPVTTPEQFEKFLSEPEGTRLEFKSARTSYEFDKIVNYCVALANECGGMMILGVTDRRPRAVVGTTAFPEPGETEASLHRIFHHRIPIEEYYHGEKRVLIIHVPSRLPGTAWQHEGKYLKRAGDALVPMGDQELRTIFAEAGPDFSAETSAASLADLSKDAIAEFRRRWAKKTQSPRIEKLSDIDLLRDAELERSGQGLNLMIENAIRQTKPLPDFSGTAAHEVRLTLHGTVQNVAFIRFLERLGEERLAHFSTHDYMTLDALRKNQPLSPAMQMRLQGLIDCGAIESVGRGKSARFFLSKELYEALGEPGTYTRRKGLDKETNKELLLKHISDHNAEGSPFEHLRQVLPALADRQIKLLLDQLKNERRIHVHGMRRWARWHVSAATSIERL